MTILIVEDEALVRMHGIDILEEAGFDVLEAADADEALVILGNGQVHVLFSDIDMPGSMDGLDLARIVCRRWPEVQLLLTSGHHRLQEADIPGSGKFVRKPWTADSLIGHVREAGRL
ncbi:MAG TPA: response regulator [Allosphingosinicella sp.]|nr:response regulator [Allosphingosinicella sp.]